MSEGGEKETKSIGQTEIQVDDLQQASLEKVPEVEEKEDEEIGRNVKIILSAATSDHFSSKLPSP